VTSVLKSLFSRENSHPDGATIVKSPSSGSLVPKGLTSGSTRLADQVIEEVDEQMTVQSIKPSHPRPSVLDIFPSTSPSRPPSSMPVDVPMGKIFFRNRVLSGKIKSTFYRNLFKCANIVQRNFKIDKSFPQVLACYFPPKESVIFFSGNLIFIISSLK